MRTACIFLVCALALTGCQRDGGTGADVDRGGATGPAVAPEDAGVVEPGGDAAPVPGSPARLAPPSRQAPAAANVTEAAVITPAGGMGPGAIRVLQGSAFLDFVSGLPRGAPDNVSRERAEVYRQAVEQTLSEIPGASPPVAFECGAAVCAGVLESGQPLDWIGAWQASLMADQLAPVKTMGLHKVVTDSGRVEHRFVFATSGEGRVSYRD